MVQKIMTKWYSNRHKEPTEKMEYRDILEIAFVVYFVIISFRIMMDLDYLKETSDMQIKVLRDVVDALKKTVAEIFKENNERN